MSLKVFDLQCDQGHTFEGWFASHDAFHDQQARGLLVCPVCDSHHIERKLSAPRLNVRHAKSMSALPPVAAESSSSAASPTEAAKPASSLAAISPEQMQTLQAQVLQYARDLVRSSENVGERFAEEARLMHHGETPERPIRGVATPQERKELHDEGIVAVPIPDFLDDDRLH